MVTTSSATHEWVAKALASLSTYCRQNDYMGWDNFDGLNSRLFRTSPFYRSGFLRLVWTQFFKRCPINFRKLTLTPKGYNPKGLALFVSGLLLNDDVDTAAKLLSQLKGMTCSGYSGASWGYNFDWQARNFLTPLGTPNAVTTVFVANALLDHYKKTNENDSLELAMNGCRFLLENLVLHEDRSMLCLGYMPGSRGRVHNVNMLGATALARVSRLTGEAGFLDKSRKAMTYAVNAMNSDFSWSYGEGKHQQFIDNFHTGFNLVSLKNWMDYSGERTWESELAGAYEYFLSNFWRGDGCPKYYHNSLYPIDIHCSAQGIVTCLELADYSEQSVPMAGKIARWAIDNMQDETGNFYYQKRRLYTNRISYIRWSQAWMFYALSKLQNYLNSTKYCKSIGAHY